ncbi:hypothetical protein SAY87_015454 [Trapa incisa]|uniref:R13L1/DRL21-like LRR repeat region domain-containing protein n=1 Tax=Trapa incisa TaxID=236973 RepID=A0AAN7JM88_9MYRT|nr:hypothetical protein SAY87_015454 [Trapa incisa]
MSLPNSIGKLLNLETLILKKCLNLESLPREVTELVNLSHLNVEGCDSLTCIPSGIGNLTNLEVLRGFRVEKRGKWNAARMNELRRLTGLEELSIEYLGRVKKESDRISTSDADYFWIDKFRLQRLQLSWEGDDDDDREYPSEYAEEVLERLKPNLDLLKSFTIEEYPGTRLPSWTSLLHNLVEIKLSSCDHIGSIPPLDQLRSLKSISLHLLQKLEWIEVTENSFCSYPSLEEVYLAELPMFKGWKMKSMDVNRKRKRMDVNRSGDQTIHSSSSSLFFIPSFSRKVHVGIYTCEMLSYMRDDNEGVLLQLERMKYKDLEELSKSRSNVEESFSISTTQMRSLMLLPLSSVPLHTVTSLHLKNLEDREELPSELFQSLSCLQSLKITECHHMRSIPPLDQLSSLESFKLVHCNNMRSIPPLDQLSSLESIKLSYCNNMRSIPPLDQLSSLESIELSYCDNMRSIPPLDQLPSLKSIWLDSLQELEWIEVTENKSICLYPSLERVYLKGLPMLKGWKRKRMDVNRSGDQTIHSSSPPSLERFTSKYGVVECSLTCGMIMKGCGCNWQE